MRIVYYSPEAPLSFHYIVGFAPWENNDVTQEGHNGQRGSNIYAKKTTSILGFQFINRLNAVLYIYM